jgi:hypothetical protein
LRPFVGLSSDIAGVTPAGKCANGGPCQSDTQFVFIRTARPGSADTRVQVNMPKDAYALPASGEDVQWSVSLDPPVLLCPSQPLKYNTGCWGPSGRAMSGLAQWNLDFMGELADPAWCEG